MNAYKENNSSEQKLIPQGKGFCSNGKERKFKECTSRTNNRPLWIVTSMNLPFQEILNLRHKELITHHYAMRNDRLLAEDHFKYIYYVIKQRRNIQSGDDWAHSQSVCLYIWWGLDLNIVLNFYAVTFTTQKWKTIMQLGLQTIIEKKMNCRNLYVKKNCKEYPYIFFIW